MFLYLSQKCWYDTGLLVNNIDFIIAQNLQRYIPFSYTKQELQTVSLQCSHIERFTIDLQSKQKFFGGFKNN